MRLAPIKSTILDALANGPLTVTELADLLDKPRPFVAIRLFRLLHAGYVAHAADGERWTLHQHNPPPQPMAQAQEAETTTPLVVMPLPDAMRTLTAHGYRVSIANDGLLVHPPGATGPQRWQRCDVVATAVGLGAQRQTPTT